MSEKTEITFMQTRLIRLASEEWHLPVEQIIQAQFLETRKFQINEIARLFRIPPHMVGDLEKSSFSNIQHIYYFPFL